MTCWCDHVRGDGVRYLDDETKRHGAGDIVDILVWTFRNPECANSMQEFWNTGFLNVGNSGVGNSGISYVNFWKFLHLV